MTESRLRRASFTSPIRKAASVCRFAICVATSKYQFQPGMRGPLSAGRADTSRTDWLNWAALRRRERGAPRKCNLAVMPSINLLREPLCQLTRTSMRTATRTLTRTYKGYPKRGLGAGVESANPAAEPRLKFAPCHLPVATIRGIRDRPSKDLRYNDRLVNNGRHSEHAADSSHRGRITG